MEQFFVTKKKYDWVVRHNGEDYDLTDDREAAIAAARRRAQAAMQAGRSSEVLVANIFGQWDKVDVTV
jgi:hypothetical protein